MKNKISLLFVIFFAFSLSGQQFNSVNYSNGLPNSFRLYVPDVTTQILFNPARAANSDQSFFYLTKNQEPTYYPIYLVYNYNNFDLEAVRLSAPNYISNYPQNNSSFSGGVLFNSSYGKVLFQTNFQLRNSDGESQSESINPVSYLTNDYNTEKINNSTNGSENLSNIDFRIDKISGTDDGGFSIGLFGQIAPNKYNGNSGSIRERIQKSNYNQSISGYNYRSYQFQKSENKSVSDGGIYTGGIEIGISRDTYDLTANASVTFSGNNTENNRYDYWNTIDSSYNNPVWQYNKHIEKESNTRSETEDLTGFRANIHYSSSANYFQDDDRYFVGITFNHQAGDHKTDGNVLYEYAQKYSDSNYWSGDSTSFKFPDYKSKTENTFIGFQTGYKTGKTFDDIKVLTGLTYVFGFSKNDYTYYNIMGYFYSGYINKNDTKDNSYLNTILLPIFISYTPTSWFDLHGGFTYEVKQNYYSSELTQNQTTYTGNNIVKNISSGKSKNNSNQTSQNLSSSLGATLKHSSGLKLYIAFNNDILSYKTWDLTLLYNF